MSYSWCILPVVMAYFQKWRTIKLAIKWVSPLNFCSFFPFLTWWENGQLLFYGGAVELFSDKHQRSNVLLCRGAGIYGDMGTGQQYSRLR